MILGSTQRKHGKIYHFAHATDFLFCNTYHIEYGEILGLGVSVKFEDLLSLFVWHAHIPKPTKHPKHIIKFDTEQLATTESASEPNAHPLHNLISSQI